MGTTFIQVWSARASAGVGGELCLSGNRRRSSKRSYKPRVAVSPGQSIPLSGQAQWLGGWRIWTGPYSHSASHAGPGIAARQVQPAGEERGREPTSRGGLLRRKDRYGAARFLQPDVPDSAD